MRKFIGLSCAERRLLMRALVVVGLIRLGLWLLPFRNLRRLLAQLTPTSTAPSNTNEPSVDRVAWAVSAAALYLPRATCLTQALAAQVLLAERGEMSDLRIGVGRDARRGVTAHAWLETRGRVVIGGELLERYIPLSLFGERESHRCPAAQTAGRTEVR